MGLAGTDATIAKARKFEAGNDYARAIETYLSLTTADTNNLDVLEQVGAGPGGRGPRVWAAALLSLPRLWSLRLT